MKPTDTKIFLSGLGLFLVQLMVLFISMAIGVEVAIHYKIWETCGINNECFSPENKIFASIYFFEIRAMFMLLISYVYCYKIYKKYSEKPLKSIIVTIALSLVWVPAIAIITGSIYIHAIYTGIPVILGGLLAFWKIKRNHITHMIRSRVNRQN